MRPSGRRSRPSGDAMARRGLRGGGRCAPAARRAPRLRRRGPRRPPAARPRLPGRHPRQAGVDVLRRLARAPEPGPRADDAVGPAAARRAHQPPRPRRGAVARGLAAEVPRHAADDLARPRVPRRRHHPHAAPATTARRSSTPATTPAFERQRAEHLRLQQIAFEKEQAEREHLQKLHRPLQGQGEQGQAGPVADEAPGQAGRHRGRARRARPAHQLRRAAEAAVSR